jgi:hypothetical protein
VFLAIVLLILAAAPIAVAHKIMLVRIAWPPGGLQGPEDLLRKITPLYKGNQR